MKPTVKIRMKKIASNKIFEIIQFYDLPFDIAIFLSWYVCNIHMTCSQCTCCQSEILSLLTLANE